MTVRSTAALLAASVLAGCVTPRPAPPPPRLIAEPFAPPAPAVPPAEAPLVQPGEDWRDIPLSAGAWRYQAASGGSRSTFGPPDQPRVTVRCDLATRVVALERPGASGTSLTIQTSSGTRTLPTQAQPGALVASLSARDPFLDAIAFSRGRFVVTSPPAPRLVIPAWPEFARVIEDCRG